MVFCVFCGVGYSNRRSEDECDDRLYYKGNSTMHLCSIDILQVNTNHFKALMPSFVKFTDFRTRSLCRYYGRK